MATEQWYTLVRFHQTPEQLTRVSQARTAQEALLLLERWAREKKSGKERQEVAYGITSLPPQLAGPPQLLRLTRGQWLIENRSHWVRDVTYGEDHSQVRSGSLPQVMAAVRNTAIGLLRWAGHANIAAATRYYAAQPREALALLGVPMTTK